MLRNQKAKLDVLEHSDQDPAAESIDQNVDERLSFHVRWSRGILPRSLTPKKLVDSPPLRLYTPKNLGD